MQGLLALFSLLAGLFKFFSEWLQRRDIRDAARNEGLVETYRRVLQLLRKGEEARAMRARLDSDPERLRRDDGDLRAE